MKKVIQLLTANYIINLEDKYWYNTDIGGIESNCSTFYIY